MKSVRKRGAAREVGEEPREVAWKPHERCLREGEVASRRDCAGARRMKAENLSLALIPWRGLELWRDRADGEVVAEPDGVGAREHDPMTSFLEYGEWRNILNESTEDTAAESNETLDRWVAQFLPQRTCKEKWRRWKKNLQIQKRLRRQSNYNG